MQFLARERFFQVRRIFNLITELITADLKGDQSFSFCFSHVDHPDPGLCPGLLRHHHHQGGHDGLVHGAPTGIGKARVLEKTFQEEPARCLKSQCSLQQLMNSTCSLTVPRGTTPQSSSGSSTMRRTLSRSSTQRGSSGEEKLDISSNTVGAFNNLVNQYR